MRKREREDGLNDLSSYLKVKEMEMKIRGARRPENKEMRESKIEREREGKREAKSESNKRLYGGSIKSKISL